MGISLAHKTAKPQTIAAQGFDCGIFSVDTRQRKKDSEIADFRVPFPCSMSTVMLDLNPSNSTGLGS